MKSNARICRTGKHITARTSAITLLNRTHASLPPYFLLEIHRGLVPLLALRAAALKDSMEDHFH